MRLNNTWYEYHRFAWAVLWAVVVLSPLYSVPALAVEVPATLTWSQRVELGMQVNGTVVAVHGRTGEQVKKGTVLVELDPRGYKAAVLRGKAQVDSARASRDEARRELQRAHELYNRTVLSDHDLTLAKIGSVKADAAYRTAQAALVQAQLNLEHSTVRAPFDAIVIARHVDVGQAVVSQLQSTPVVVVAEAGRMLARAAVSNKDLAAVKPGQAATVQIGDQRFHGKVMRIGLEPVTGAGQSYPVEVEFATQGHMLRAGEPATVTLP